MHTLFSRRALRPLLTLGALIALVSGCAVAQVPQPIADTEPEVTAQVAAEMARQAADPAAQAATLLRPCAAQPPLELLRRSVDGEERTYLYRARCGRPVLVTATYGKGGTIKRLQVKEE
jgi:hypothetical protein